jgi:hypothetical protein
MVLPEPADWTAHAGAWTAVVAGGNNRTGGGGSDGTVSGGCTNINGTIMSTIMCGLRLAATRTQKGNASLEIDLELHPDSQFRRGPPALTTQSQGTLETAYNVLGNLW